ncbi:hypothetical protein FRC98_13100 [Lujinxingia vulgaris]|uniref:Uncharacterized protein n=1 Tax=Lujinxingia vulgaris TaxID=2600176 RepID=A0A5C6XB85_9DELT|nr:hypothetical protein [Lujinxingia vulgaris]TXD36057.1 hypothetical protein FRC98_13100 [Lujinxingia vulgaris]
MRPVMQTLQRPIVYRSAIALYVVMMLGLITASVAIGNRDVRSALYLTGSPTWNTHQPQALRALYFDAATGARLAPDDFEIRWSAPDAAPLATAEAGPGHYLHIQIPPYDSLAPRQNSDSHDSLAPRQNSDSHDSLAPDQNNDSHDSLAPDQNNDSHDSLAPRKNNHSHDSLAPRKNNHSYDSLAPRKNNHSHDSLAPDQNNDSHDSLAPDASAETREICALARRESFPELHDCWTIELRQPPRSPSESLQLAIGPPTSRDPEQDDRRAPLTAEDPTSPLTLQIGPTDGELVRGLPDTLGLRVMERASGQPLRAHLDITLERGLTQAPLKSSLTTDALGLAALPINALTELTLKITATPLDNSDDAPSTFTLRLPTVAAQFAIDMPRPYVVAGQPVEGAVSTILTDSPFMTDLFAGSSMIAASAFGSSKNAGGFTLPTPEADAIGPLARVQVYQSFFGAGDAWDIAHLLVLNDGSPQTLRETTSLLLDYLHTNHPDEHWDVYRDLFTPPHSPSVDTPERIAPLIRFALSRLPRDFQSPQPLLNTREEDRRELEAWKDDLQRDLYHMMIVVLLVGLLIVAYFALLGVRRLRREKSLLAEIDLELDAPLTDNSDARIEDLVTLFQAFIVFATIALFGLGIILVVSYL